MTLWALAISEGFKDLWKINGLEHDYLAYIYSNGFYMIKILDYANSNFGKNNFIFCAFLYFWSINKKTNFNEEDS